MNISRIMHTNTKQTKVWNAIIFFFPMAVPVHGQLKYEHKITIITKINEFEIDRRK